MPAISLDTLNRILPIDKQQQIIDSVFGKQQPAVANPDPSVAPSPTPVQTATQTAANSYREMLDTRKTALEQQRTDSAKMAKYNALGNLLTSMVQPIGWAAGGSTAGVIPYDSRQYLDSFNRALKADEQLRNIGTMEAEYQFKLDEEARQRAIAEETRKKSLEEEVNAYEKKRQLDAQFGVNSGKTGQALYEDRKSKAVEAWTIHNNGMTLSEYMDSLNAAHPGYFGENYKPDRDTLEKIEKQVKGRAKANAKPVKPVKPPKNDKGDNSNKNLALTGVTV